MAQDESYRDPTNLQSKLQKHQAFEAELSSNKGRVDSVCKVRQCYWSTSLFNGNFSIYMYFSVVHHSVYSNNVYVNVRVDSRTMCESNFEL